MRLPSASQNCACKSGRARPELQGHFVEADWRPELFPGPDRAAAGIFRSRLNACSFFPGPGKSCRRSVGFGKFLLQPGLGPEKVQASSRPPQNAPATPAGPGRICRHNFGRLMGASRLILGAARLADRASPRRLNSAQNFATPGRRIACFRYTPISTLRLVPARPRSLALG